MFLSQCTWNRDEVKDSVTQIQAEVVPKGFVEIRSEFIDSLAATESKLGTLSPRLRDALEVIMKVSLKCISDLSYFIISQLIFCAEI